MNTNRLIQIYVCISLIAYSIILDTSNCIASGKTGAEVFGLLKNRDQAIKSEVPKTATFNILTEASLFDPKQGSLIKYCSVIWGNSDIKMKILYHYNQDPFYVPPGSTYQPINYDEDKRLIVWRFLETYIVSTPEKTEKLDKIQRLYVSPDGKIEKSTGIYNSKHVFHANSRVSGDGDFTFFLLSTGLGFSDYVDSNNIELVKMSDGNRIEINSRGTFGKDTKGRWELTVDPNTDYFVREASFTAEGFDKPSLKISTSSIVDKDGLKYAREAHMTCGDSFVREYIDIDITMRDNQELRQEVGQIMESPLPSGSEVIDFNEGEPVRTTIK
jgi:hypothetical protein